MSATALAQRGRGAEINDQRYFSSAFTRVAPLILDEWTDPGLTWPVYGPIKAGTFSMWVSESSPGNAKNLYLVIYRDGFPIAYSNPVGMSADTTSGFDKQLTVSFPASALPGPHVFTVTIGGCPTGTVATGARSGTFVSATPTTPTFGVPSARVSVPSDFYGLASWVRGDSIKQVNGSAVALWPDKTVFGRSMVQATTVKQPKFLAKGIGGRPSIHLIYDGTNQQQLNYATYWASAFTAGEIFAVLSIDRDPPNSAVNGLWRMGTAGGDNSFYRYTSNDWYDDWGSTTRPTYGIPTPTSHYLSNPHVLDITSAASAKTVWIDGVQLYTSASNTVGFPSSGVFGIGQSQTFGCAGAIVAEIAIYNRVLSAGERASLTAGLRARYGI